MSNLLAISSASQATVQTLQRSAEVRAKIFNQLSQGLRVSRPSDGPAAFFQAKGLTNRVSDLLQAKDGIGQAVSSVETALVGTSAINDLSKQLKGIALSARNATSTSQRQAAASQFDELRRQITSIANDASYNGISSIGSSPNNLDVSLNGSGSSSVTVNGAASDAAGLGIGNAASFNNFATSADITNAVANVDAAITTLRSRSSGFGSDVALLQIRSTFTQNLTNTLTEGAAKLVSADLNGAAAALLSEQTRSQLALQGLQVLASGEKLVARLL